MQAFFPDSFKVCGKSAESEKERRQTVALLEC